MGSPEEASLGRTSYTQTLWIPRLHTFFRMFENEVLCVTLANRDCWTGLTRLATVDASHVESFWGFFLPSFIRSLRGVKVNEQQVATVKNKNMWLPIKASASVSSLLSVHFYCHTSPYLRNRFTGQCSCFLCVPSSEVKGDTMQSLSSNCPRKPQHRF